MSETLKLSEAAKLCGVSATTLKLLIADQLLPQAIRATNGGAYLPDDAVPTWEECRRLIEKRRDYHLARAVKLVDRIGVEMEAVRNDIAEARENPNEPLGVDLLSCSVWGHSGQTTLATVLQQFELARMNIERYHEALVAIYERDRP
ncbi:DNA-binding protein [Mycobacterium sp. TY815]|uniref:MerR family transcriptional regulator n=1 Tax=Mycobacterium sp. TY815 TaxID=3050581 RepID=UPI002741CC64|nr:DNA-binding protein [Mycobacterium sp. TY815]MDP7707439.1 DNA-binding protein [Mycobacterium sp. TY815]